MSCTALSRSTIYYMRCNKEFYIFKNNSASSFSVTPQFISSTSHFLSPQISNFPNSNKSQYFVIWIFFFFFFSSFLIIWYSKLYPINSMNMCQTHRIIIKSKILISKEYVVMGCQICFLSLITYLINYL